MEIKKREFILKTGETVIIKSSTILDADQIKEHREITSKETYFMAREPEDGPFNLEKIRDGILSFNESKRDFMVTAFVDGKVIGDMGVNCIKPHVKYLHRASLGISIKQQYCNMGIGSIMLNIAVEQAKENGFEQLELGVFEDNTRAIHAYKKVGFTEVGRTPHAFKLPDGTYRDEVIMVCPLDIGDGFFGNISVLNGNRDEK